MTISTELPFDVFCLIDAFAQDWTLEKLQNACRQIPVRDSCHIQHQQVYF